MDWVNSQPIILLFLSAALLSLAVWMLRRYQRSLSITYYSLFLLALAGIAATNGWLLSNWAGPTPLRLTQVGYFFGVLTFSMLAMFSLYYPIPSTRIPKRPELFWIVPVVFFLPFIFLSSIFISSVTVGVGSTHEIYGSGFWIFPVFVIAYLVWSLVNFARKLRLAQGREQQATLTMIWAVSLASISGSVFDVIIPATGRPHMPIGIYSSAVLFGLSVFFIARK